MSGRPCCSLFPMIQPPPWICSSTGAPGPASALRYTSRRCRLPAAVDVLDAAHALDARRLGANGSKTRRHSNRCGGRTRSGFSVVAPTRAQTFVQCGREGASRRACVPHDPCQSGARHHGEREAQPARPRVECAERDERGSDHDLPEDDPQRELGREPRREEGGGHQPRRAVRRPQGDGGAREADDREDEYQVAWSRNHGSGGEFRARLPRNHRGRA